MVETVEAAAAAWVAEWGRGWQAAYVSFSHSTIPCSEEVAAIRFELACIGLGSYGNKTTIRASVGLGGQDERRQSPRGAPASAVRPD